MNATPVEFSESSPRLIVVRAIAPGEMGRVLALDRGRLVLGREVGCELRFDDTGVSRRHACLERQPDGTWLVTDLNSTNGLFLNDRRVEHARLSPGDELRLGPDAVMRMVANAGAEGTAAGRRAASMVAFWSYDPARCELTWSDAIDRMLDLPEGTLSKAPMALETLFATEDCPRILAGLEVAMRGAPLNLEVALQVKSRRVELRGERVQAGPEGWPRIDGCAWDVTERYQASLKLRHHGALFESFSDPVALLDLDGRVLDCNTATVRLFGTQKDALIGRTLDSPGNPEWTSAALDRVRRLGRYEGEWRQPGQNGAEVVCEVVVTPLLDSDGAPLGFVVVHRDVTETRHLHARLALADRLSAMGTLSAGIAHEINNPLAYLRANLEHILSCQTSEGPRDPSAKADLEESIRDSAEGVERIARIVRDLKFFSRAGAAEVAPTEVSAALKLACKMASPMVRPRAELAVDNAVVPLVYADEARLAQVILNLLINAAQSMPEDRDGGNRIQVVVRDSGDGVLIEVTDNGVGMTPDVLRRAFDPFFTTKATGVGSGLGLSICHGIIEGFGGTISAKSTPGVGTTFRVWLMRSEEQRSTASEGKPETLSGPPLSLLLVDDDARVLKALKRMLGTTHQVTVAHDGAEAMGLLRSGATFDLVLCDVIMPAMNGVELHHWAGTEVPLLASRFVFMTGGGLSSALQSRLDGLGLTVLEKPLDHAPLFQVLEARAKVISSGRRTGIDTVRHLRAVS